MPAINARWSKSGPFEKNVKNLLTNGTVTIDDDPKKVFNNYATSLWPGVRYDTFRKHFRRIIKEMEQNELPAANDSFPVIQPGDDPSVMLVNGPVGGTPHKSHSSGGNVTPNSKASKNSNVGNFPGKDKLNVLYTK